VESPRRKPIIGIAGGIGSGKSTVAAEFAELGCAVIDADKIAHELLDEPDVYGQIVGAFGRQILNRENKIDSSKLAEVVFSGPDNVSRLNSIIHPPVLVRIERLIRQLNRRDAVKAIVLDIPLLFEAGWEKRCDRLIFIDCNEALRAERVKKMGLFDENQLKSRENFQISLDKKAERCDNTIDNNSGFEALATQVTGIFTNIVNDG